MNTHHFFRLVCFGLLATGAGPHQFSWGAGPTNDSPRTLLALWSDETVAAEPAAIFSRAHKLYEGLPDAVEKYETAVKGKKANRLKRMEVGRTRFMVEHLQHLAAMLEDWGEPAGFDLSQRGKQLAFRMNTIYSAVMGAPETVPQINTTKVQQHARKNEKKLQQVNKLIDEKNFDAAAKLLLPIYVDLVSAGCWYEHNQRLSMIGNFDLAYNRLIAEQGRDNETVARKSVAELAQQKRPRFDDMMAELAAVKLSPDGTGAWNGKSLTRPKLVAAMLASLQSLDGETLRTHGIEFASVEAGKTPPDAEKLRADYNACFTATVGAVKKIIEADAASAKADEAVQRYGGYLAAICAFAARVGDTSSIDELADALDKLAAKSEPLTADIAAYRGATGDWLRWRKRASSAAVKARTAKSPGFALKSNGPRGLIEAPAPDLIDAAMKLLGDQPLVADAGLLATTDKTCCSPTTGAVALRVPDPELDMDAILGSDLLISKGKIPLTLEVGMAYARARRGNLAAAGGKLRSIELIGTVPLQATDYPERSALYPADSVTAANTTLASTRSDQVVYIITLMPEWIAGEHYFVGGGPSAN